MKAEGIRGQGNGLLNPLGEEKGLAAERKAEQNSVNQCKSVSKKNSPCSPRAPRLKYDKKRAMQKDFKIGLFVGMVVVASATIWLCTQPMFSTKSRAVQTPSNIPPNLAQINNETKPPPVIQQTTIPDTNLEKPLRIHVVQKGETLSQIAEKYYGSPRNWLKILNANRAALPDPNRLVPGFRLFIPE
jgi:nucleoid-associated protein YgaU